MARINNLSLVQLAKGSTVFRRGPNLLQFGLDSTRTGIIETSCVEELVLLIDATRNPTPVNRLHSNIAALIGQEAARSLVADLVSYRILIPADARHIAMMGSSPLAQQLTSILTECGFEVLTRLETADPWAPLVAVDQLAHATAVARMSRLRSGPTIPVTLIDSRVVVGPVRFTSTDPCLACANAHLQDIDVLWRETLAVNSLGTKDPDPVITAAGVAAAAAIIRRVAGLPDPPGVSARLIAPGEVVVVDPFGPRPVATHELSHHPRCRVCY